MEHLYLDQLNDQQRSAVEYIAGPQRVIAGAGSGKTRVLTYKIVHLLAQGYEPYRILALTFTNKAAREMRTRIEALTGAECASRLWMGTFHSIFSRILRTYADRIGHTRNYTIYDQTDARSLVKLIIKDMQLDEKIYKPATVHNAISWAKNALISPEAYAADAALMQADRDGRRPLIAEIYRTYNARCRMADAMDFDDLLYYTAVLLRDNEDVLRHFREFFRYVLVDEYQDTNFAQNYILTILTRGIGNLCVVGDDAQSIYSFRGANIQNILNLNKDFPTLQTFKLEQNYRSTQNIINAANKLIAKNQFQIPKNVFSLNDAGSLVEVQAGHSDYDEAGLVATDIVKRRAVTGDPLSEFAILYRTNAQSRQLEEALRRRNLSYRIYGGLAFYQRKEIKDAVSYFRMCVNPNDDEALRRIINVPARGIGGTTMDKVTAAAFQSEKSMWEIVSNPTLYSLPVNSGTMKKLAGFVETINSLTANIQGMNAEDAARSIIKQTGMISSLLSEKTPENVSRIQNLEELIKGAHEFVQDRQESGDPEHTSLADYLAQAALQTDQDNEDPALADSVSLMTIHGAKGLEFNNIYVVGVEENLLPSGMAGDSPEEIEEERRLFYVALTRARRHCVLTYADTRYLNGQPTMCRPSRFLRDIGPSLLKFSYGARPSVAYPQAERPRTQTPPQPLRQPVNLNTPSPRPSAPTPKAAPGAAHSVSNLKEGMAIMHATFGRGVIQRVESSDIGDAVIVDFDNQPQPKKLLLKFAKFNIIEQ